MITPQQFVAAVRSLLGAPVVHRGRSRAAGLDCVGVPIAAARACGEMVAEPTPYGRLPSGEEMHAGLASYCVRIPLEEREPGDLLMVMYGRQARHCVVLVGANECGQEIVVHALGSRGKVSEDLLVDPVECWRPRFLLAAIALMAEATREGERLGDGIFGALKSTGNLRPALAAIAADLAKGSA